MKTKTLPSALRAAADAVLITKTFAKTMRAEVDVIQRAVLAECPLHFSKEIRRIAGDEKEITEPSRAWMGDREEFLDFCQECSKRERAAGLKPADMDDDHCPALVAEDINRQAEHLMIQIAGEWLRPDMDGKAFHHALLCSGMERYRKFIDLIIGAHVNAPGFKNPLTHATA